MPIKRMKILSEDRKKELLIDKAPNVRMSVDVEPDRECELVLLVLPSMLNDADRNKISAAIIAAVTREISVQFMLSFPTTPASEVPTNQQIMVDTMGDIIRRKSTPDPEQELIDESLF